tara:strand:+ start:922 stop:1254 length:333 start_codon:yes stop_codon:yes gene_type:complete
MTSYNKFKNKPQVVDNIRFASIKEANRYCELKLMVKESEIKNLECHPKIPLMVNGVNCGFYIADFKYYDNAFKKVIVEDVKSKATITPLYSLKKKIIATYNPPIEIIEIF